MCPLPRPPEADLRDVWTVVAQCGGCLAGFLGWRNLELLTARLAEGEQWIQIAGRSDFGEQPNVLVRLEVRGADLRHDLLRLEQGRRPSEQPDRAHDRIE